MHLINYLTRIQFGFGTRKVLGQEADLAGIKCPLVVTDKGVRAAGIVDQVLAGMAGASEFPIFDETPSNPTENAVRQATEIFHERGCDGVIAIGGGSAIDLAKGVAVAARHDGPLKDFAAIEGGIGRITAATAPVIAVPTTAGTGSEVGRGAIIILDDLRKVGLISPYLIPKAAICDPELTFGLPPLLTAATGMDAISHCVETYLSPAFNPPADGIALEGLRRGWKHLARATFTPDDREARLNMMSASLLGALAFQKGLGCVHSLSHSLGGLNPRLHHGTLNAVFMPAVIEFNASSLSVRQEDKLGIVATIMGIPGPADVANAVVDMTARLGLPRSLSEMGVERDLFPRIVEGALADHCHRTNPREATPENYTGLLVASF